MDPRAFVHFKVPPRWTGGGSGLGAQMGLRQIPGEGYLGRKLSSWLTPGGGVTSGSCINPRKGVARPVGSKIAGRVVQTALKRELIAAGHGLGWSCYRGSELDVGGQWPSPSRLRSTCCG